MALLKYKSNPYPANVGNMVSS